MKPSYIRVFAYESSGPETAIHNIETKGRDCMTDVIKCGPQVIQPEEHLIDRINRCGISMPQDCYHPSLGPFQSCDTCMV